MIKNFLILFPAFLILECAIIPALAIPRLAVIAETEDARPASDILTAQLSKSKDYAVLERDEIAKIFREQQIALEGLTEQSDLSRLTGADGLILLRPMEKGSQRLLLARIVAVHPGVVLDTLFCPLPCTDYDAWASLISTRVKQLLPKFEVLARDAIAVSILNIRAEYETETTKSLERNLNKLLFTRLVQEPRVFVLERQSLDKLVREKSFSLKSEDKFWTASYILDGSFSEVHTNNITLNVNLLAPDGTRITNIVNTEASSSVDSIVDRTAIRIFKTLQIAPSSVLWSPKDEAQRYYQEALWANRWKLYPESIYAIESSWALGNQTEEVAFQRLQCYLQALPPQDDAPFIIKRLLEHCLDYRRVFPQKSLKTVAYVDRGGLRWSASSEEEVNKAHYYKEVINAASALLQKENQNLAWGLKYHDVLSDIRSLILNLCMAIDRQAEKEEIASPINDFLISLGGCWYENPRDYVAALYRSLDGRNDSKAALFVAISGQARWPDKVLQTFDQYGPEFNRELCHSSNSVNRLIGHYCALKWITTNRVALTGSMDHLMDDLWENRDVILSPYSRFDLMLICMNQGHGPDSDFNVNYHYYLDTFRLWKEKALILSADTRTQYDDKILAFHRKFLLAAINSRQIPFGWFRPVFEDHLNMSIEEGQSFYNTYLSNPTNVPDDIRNAFYVVYISRKVPIEIHERSATNSFRIKMHHFGLTANLANRLIEERDLPTTQPPPPAQSIITSPYQSLVVTQYYSLPGKVHSISYANGKIWVTLGQNWATSPDRLVVLGENSFTSTVVHAIARPDIQWVGSNLFLDTGSEITCLTLGNQTKQRWPKPNGDNDFCFYVYKNDLFFFRNGLIFHTDLKTGVSRVIASSRRNPCQTLLDGSEFTVERFFGSSDHPLALIGGGPQGSGVYAFDVATTNWWLADKSIGGGYLIGKEYEDGILYFQANLDGSGIEFWSSKVRNKQLLLGSNYESYKSKWAIPPRMDFSIGHNNSLDCPGKIAEYDGNNLYYLNRPKYDNYQILLWFFKKGHDTGVPVQLVFQTNNVMPGAEAIPIPTVGAVYERDMPTMAVLPFKVKHTTSYIFTGYSKGLIMSMKGSTGFWFIPMEDILAHMTPKPVLLQQQANLHNASFVPFESVALFSNEQVTTSADNCGPIPGQTYAVNLGAGVKLEMVWVPPGEFMMGSPLSEAERYAGETQHKVIIAKGFWMGKYEVTQEQWRRVMEKKPSQSIGASWPVYMVTWHDCQKFVGKLNSLISDQNSANRSFRFGLPTEAEWEYACRAGTTNRFYTGDTDSDLDRAGWYWGNSKNVAHPVGQKQPNAWGLYDMHGNVCEWCEDWYAEYETVAVKDPKGMNSGDARIDRGGFYNSPPEGCRSAMRLGHDPGSQVSGAGFRVVLRP